MSLLTYENDTDLGQLIYTDVTDEKVLDFFFKKGGTVNVNNLMYCVHLYSTKGIAPNIVSLETAGLITPISSFQYKVTRKARWQRFRDSKSIVFWGIVAAIIATLILLLQVANIL